MPEPAAVVIGGGVMGLGAARDLRRRGFAVTLLERHQPARGASWASAGIIGATLRDESDPSVLLRRVSRERWPGFARDLAQASGLDPEYRETGCLFVARDPAEVDGLRQSARRARPEDRPTLLEGAALVEAEPALAGGVVRAGLQVAGGNVEVRRLGRAMDLAARHAGVDVRTACEARALVQAGGRVRGVETADGTLPADVVVLAAGAWAATVEGCQPAAPVRPQRGQILALDQARVGIRHVLQTATDPYLVPRADGRLVVGATREEAGWDASLTAGGVAWLLDSAIAIAPGLRACPIAEMWTGFRPMSPDGLPLIGRGALDGLFFLTGHGPSGIAPLPGSLALLDALIAGGTPPLPAEPFDPLRFAH